MLELVYTSTKTVPTPSVFMDIRYMKPWRAFWTNYTTLDRDPGDSIRKILHDGTCLDMSYGTWPYLQDPLSLVGGNTGFYQRISWDPPPGWSKKVFPADEFLGTMEIKKGVSTTLTTLANRCMVDLENELIYEPGSNKVIVKNLSDGSTVREMTGLTGVNLFSDIHWVRNNEAVAMYYSTGIVVFFNYITGDLLLKTKVTPYENGAGAYDCVNHVIMTIQSDLKTRIYVPTPVPNHFSGPTLSPVSPEQWGHSHVTVQLLGDQNEPCADWWVHWRLVNGKGWLEDLVSKTDKDGYAYNYYYSPTLESQLGSETLYAEVVA